jgi:hypothetical protein
MTKVPVTMTMITGGFHEKSTSTYTRKHWLHKAYLIGFDAGVNKNDECPYCCGTKEWEWWWAGWGEGVIA